MASPESKGPERTDYDNIASTALRTARGRAIAGIDYAQELHDAAVALLSSPARPQESIAELREHAPDREARDMLTRQLIREIDNTQVIDIASGLSTLWSDDPNRRYVDFDLPVMMHLKQAAIAKVPALDEIVRGCSNIHFEAGNALDKKALLHAARHVTPGVPVTVITTGLLHYLTLKERAVLAHNIGTVLDLGGEGSVWITDMPSWEGITERDTLVAGPTSTQTGRDVAGMRFVDNAQASAFFARHGLPEVKERRPFDSILNQLQSLQKLGISQDEVREKIRPWSLWILGRQPATQR